MHKTVQVLGPVTSLYVWRACVRGLVAWPQGEPREVDLRLARGRLRDLRQVEVLRALRLPSYDVIVGDPRQIHRCQQLDAIMLHGSMPLGSFRELGEGVYVCSPELCFLLLARGDQGAHLAELGCELCGLYRVDPAGSAGHLRSIPVSSTAALASYLAQVGRRHGVKRARRVLAQVSDGCRSPWQTSLYLSLAAPVAHGGYGIAALAPVYGFDLRRSRAGQGVATPGAHPCLDRDGEVSWAVVEGAYGRKVPPPAAGAGLALADALVFSPDDARRFDRFDEKAQQAVRMAGLRPRDSRGVLRERRFDLFLELHDGRRWVREHELLREMAGYERGIRHATQGVRLQEMRAS